MTLNYYPSEASKRNTMDLRPIGLGLMGLADVFVLLGVAFDDAEAVRISDRLGEFIQKKALQASQDLAKERGAFAHYNPETYTYEARRNALLMAIAPTASISLIAGTSSTVDPYFSNIYSRETLGGKFTIVNEYLVDLCKEKGIRNEQLKNKIIANNGSVQGMEELEWHVDASVFKTSYEVDRKSQIDVAAALQKHVDQAISRNMYLDESQRAEMYDVYMYAWKKWLKWTYYCFIEKKLQGEKYTQTVNKSAGRSGFGAKTSTEGVASTEVCESPEAEKSDSTAPAGRGFGARWFATPAAVNTSPSTNELSDIDLKNASEDDKAKIRDMLIQKKGADYVAKLESGELYANGSCPMDPFEKVMCTSCQ